MFTSGRAVHTNRYTQLFTVPVDGGMPEQLPIPNAAKATFSPDGSHIAYLPLGERFRQWKNYRGGTHSRLWLYDTRRPLGGRDPAARGALQRHRPDVVRGYTVYFLSDRAGEFNLFSLRCRLRGRSSSSPSYDDFPILAAVHGDGKIIYEQAGYLHLYDPANGPGNGTKLTVGVPADLLEVRPRWVTGTRYIRSA